MTEKIKTNPDFTASAVNLTNPEGVRHLYCQLRQAQETLDATSCAIEASVPANLKAERKLYEEAVTRLEKFLREAIDAEGSYQDLACGSYALKQRRETVRYSPAMTRQALPMKLADLVVVDTVDARKLEGLVKGGLVTPDQAKQCGEVTLSYAYIIR